MQSLSRFLTIGFYKNTIIQTFLKTPTIKSLVKILFFGKSSPWNYSIKVSNLNFLNFASCNKLCIALTRFEADLNYLCCLKIWLKLVNTFDLGQLLQFWINTRTFSSDACNYHRTLFSLLNEAVVWNRQYQLLETLLLASVYLNILLH